MNNYVLHEATGRGRSQWLLSAAAIVAAHFGLIAAAVAWYQQAPAPGVEMPAILVDMAPVSAAPALQPQDLAPGPQMQEAPPSQQEAKQPPPAPAPEAPQQFASDQPAPPAPLLPTPDVVLPQPPAAIERAEREEPKPKREEVKRERIKRDAAKSKPHPHPPAPRTTGAPKAERQAALAAAASAGQAAAAAALPSYRDRLAAHLARYKQYPAESRATREQGTAMLSFTVGRSGQVLGSRLARSSGHAALDAETLAMIRRAQPLPPFPSEITQSSLSFTVPVRFSLQ
ncbi:energy transducer TonB [Rhodopseudomonas sp. BR0M22]|uniref:energy transducer TonB family protein n=1 Tax=Rhodopseudomonas sp. BR0M22 TaxID=2269369 RepID=UPI0013DF015D|nr:energy transducer TonB [Rhodopseudomonas sp. BR0M22]NEW90982.1 energy transducer TonB [Rhodopseudomonas sp. BR0M22]